ncbi:MAG: hypothetical protein Q8S19_10295 [Bacillota bacterium]|nr:hypothetical protein [Bacillota bacterium]
MEVIRVNNAKEKLHYVMAADVPPVAKANPGDTIIFECVDAYCNQIKDESTLFSEYCGPNWAIDTVNLSHLCGENEPRSGWGELGGQGLIRG